MERKRTRISIKESAICDMFLAACKTNYGIARARAYYKDMAEIAQSEYAKFTHNWMEQASQTLKESGSMYVFSGCERILEIYLQDLILAGLTDSVNDL